MALGKPDDLARTETCPVGRMIFSPAVLAERRAAALFSRFFRVALSFETFGGSALRDFLLMLHFNRQKINMFDLFAWAVGLWHG
jgi:hypothetical protein